MRHPALLIAAAAYISACSEPQGVLLTPSSLSGGFVLDSVNSRPLPATVNTTWLSGTIQSGRLDIDRDAYYWIRLVTRPTGRGTEQLNSNGYVEADTARRIAFFDPFGTLRWQGTFLRTTITVPDMGGVSVQFRWTGPYRRPQ